MPDVTIIGGGPAGATCAILLARGGWDVTLVEQSRFPRDKVCGECLSALGFDVLTRIGLAETFLSLGAVRLNRAEIRAPGGRPMRVALPAPMWGLSRSAFDTMLLDAARGVGARVRQPARCEAVDGSVRIRDLETNTVETLKPSHVLLADGKGAFADERPPRTGDFGIKAHFIDVDGPRDAIELFSIRKSYGGLAAIEGGRWNTAFSVPSTRIQASRGDLDGLFAEMLCENPTLARRFTAARRVGPWLASPLPRFSVRGLWQSDVIPIGNAAAALEPIGGEGMGLAMRSAELAATSLLSCCHDDVKLLGAFRRLWGVRSLACRAAGIAASRPLVSTPLAVMRLPGVAVRAALRLVGK
jgi:flavin-dependent dehydrogenase